MKENLTIAKKKRLIEKLKNAAIYYRDYLLGKSFLVLYNENQFVEVLFKKSDFMHLTGVSSNLNAERFFDVCLKKGSDKRYIRESDIFTTTLHPFHLAIKKLEVFAEIHNVFYKASYLLEDIRFEKSSYTFGVANFELTLLCERYSNNTYLRLLTKKINSLFIL